MLLGPNQASSPGLQIVNYYQLSMFSSDPDSGQQGHHAGAAQRVPRLLQPLRQEQDGKTLAGGVQVMPHLARILRRTGRKSSLIFVPHVVMSYTGLVN